MWRPVVSRKPLMFLSCAVLVVALSACNPRVQKTGNIPDPERLSEIVPGEVSRDEVAEILGSPSSIPAFDQETWLYISETRETLAFFQPEVTERQIVMVRFDKEGVVSKVDTLTAEDGQEITPEDRVTPTAGLELTFVEQLIGNFNRLNALGGAGGNN